MFIYAASTRHVDFEQSAIDHDEGICDIETFYFVFVDILFFIKLLFFLQSKSQLKNRVKFIRLRLGFNKARVLFHNVKTLVYTYDSVFFEKSGVVL